MLEDAMQLWGCLGQGLQVLATLHIQAEGSVWLALSQLFCESFQCRLALFPCFMPGVGILIKHLCFWRLLASHDDGKKERARVLFVYQLIAKELYC